MAGRAGVGVIGVGAIAKYWLQAVHEHPHADLAAVCDTRPPRDSNAFHVPYYTDHAEYNSVCRSSSLRSVNCRSHPRLSSFYIV